MPTYSSFRSTGDSARDPMDDRGFIEGSFAEPWTIAVLTGAADADSVDVKRNSGIPKPNDKHARHSSYRVVDVNVNQISAAYFEAEISYETPRRQEGEDDEEGSAIDFKAEVVWSSLDSEEAMSIDADGDATVTANDELLIGITRTVSDLVATIKQNFTSYDPSTFYLFKNKVNDDEFLGFPAGTARTKAPHAVPRKLDDEPYHEVTLQVIFREPGPDMTEEEAWHERVIHQGELVRQEIGGPIGAPVDGLGRDIDGVKVRMDSDGVQLQAGDPTEFLLIKKYETATFDDMGFNF